MSRYVSHKNGMVIGDDNWFFVIDRADGWNNEPPLELPEGVKDLRDGYKAILSFEGYSFKQVNSLTCFLKTPAEQLVFEDRLLEWEYEWQRSNGETMMLPGQKRYSVVRDWVVRWLEEQVGPRYEAWDTYTRCTSSNNGLFFERRKHALALVRMINKQLEGMEIRKW